MQKKRDPALKHIQKKKLKRYQEIVEGPTGLCLRFELIKV